MQLKIILSGNRIKLPLASASTVQGLIYNALHSDSSFSHNLHENGHSFNQRKFKLFSFSELRGNYTIFEKQIIFDNRISLEIRSVDAYMIQLLYSYFSSNKTVTLGNNTVNIESATLENKMIFSDRVKVKTASPITVYSTTEDGHTIYFSPHEESFYEAIAENAKRKQNSYLKGISDFDFSITPAEDAHFIKRATRFKSTFITAWHGEFYLQGSIEVLNFLYNTGLGSKNSQGFGMFYVL